MKREDITNIFAEATKEQIDQRTLDSVRNDDVQLFSQEVEIARLYYSYAAELLSYDLDLSTPGQRFFIDRSGQNYNDDPRVIGVKRATSPMLAEIKDGYNLTWEQLGKLIGDFVEVKNSADFAPVKNTLNHRRMEIYLHEILTHGITLMDGTQIAPSTEYAEYIAQYQGSQGDGLNVEISENAIPFETFFNEELLDAWYAEHGSEQDVKYSTRESFEEQINKLREGTFPHYDHLYVMDTPDVLIKAGLPRLPILMTQNHAWSVMKESGKKNVNYHGFTKTGMANLPNAIANSFAVIRAAGYTDRVIAFTDMKNAKGETVITPIVINGKGRWQSAEIDANILTTAYGKSNLKDMIVKAIMNDDVLYVDKKRSYALEKSVGVQFPKNLLSGASKQSIAQNSEDVKFQKRDPYNASDREMLANALESSVTNEQDLHRLRLYQKKIGELNETQQKLQETRQKIKELREEDWKANKDELTRLKNQADIYAQQISRADSKLMDLEALAPLKELAKQQRAEYQRELRQKTNKQVQQYRREVTRQSKRIAKLEALVGDPEQVINDAKQKGREAQRKSQRRTELRRQIRDDVKTMYEWVGSPTNNAHVPEALRKSLGEFLQSIDTRSAKQVSGGAFQNYVDLSHRNVFGKSCCKHLRSSSAKRV